MLTRSLCLPSAACIAVRVQLRSYGLLEPDSCFVSDFDHSVALSEESLCAQRFTAGPWFIPVWALFGGFDVGALEDSRQLLPSLFLIALLIIAQVLLLNLLIAIMTDTYATVNSGALAEWQ